MKSRILIITLIIVGVALLTYGLNNRSHGSTARTLNLAEYGVALEIPATLSKLHYVARDESTNGPGIILHMYSGDGGGCDLGALYQIRKNEIASSKTTWTEQTLEQFSVPQGTKPAQVKEFTDFYLVFEPNPTLCATDEKEKAQEAAEQHDLWNALSTAHYMQY